MRRIAFHPAGVTAVLTIAPIMTPWNRADHWPGLPPNSGHVYTIARTARNTRARIPAPSHDTVSAANYPVS